MSKISIEPAAHVQAGANDNKNPKRPKHRQLGGATAGLFISVGGLIAGRLGQLYPVFDVFAQFAMQFMIIAVSFAVAVFFKRFKGMIGWILTVVLLVLYGAFPHLVSSVKVDRKVALAAGEKQIRIAHFNSYKNNFDYVRIADEILRLDADVVSLVELSPQKKAAIFPALKIIYPHSFDCTAAYCDLAVLSKYPILSSEGEGVWAGAPYIRVALGGEMTGVSVVSVHTTRFPFSRSQLKQVGELVHKLENVTGDMVIAGDFNATPFSRVTTTLEQGANVTRLTDLPTWPTHLNLPQLAIDHIFASQNFRVVGKPQIGEAAGSDHYPIVITLALKRSPLSQ